MIQKESKKWSALNHVYHFISSVSPAMARLSVSNQSMQPLSGSVTWTSMEMLHPVDSLKFQWAQGIFCTIHIPWLIVLIFFKLTLCLFINLGTIQFQPDLLTGKHFSMMPVSLSRDSFCRRTNWQMVKLLICIARLLMSGLWDFWKLCHLIFLRRLSL